MKIILSPIILGLVLLLGFYFLPWKNVNWGNIKFLAQETVTVSGEAQSKQQAQIASFNVGVSAVNDDKQKAVDEVSQKITAIIEAVKNFGIKKEDIKTQNLSVYQSQQTYYDNGVLKQKPGQWQVNNTVLVTLRDVSRASELTDLLTKGGATNVYGPNFTIDNTIQPETSLLDDAMKNAREKAEKIAMAGGKKLGKVISVTEGISQTKIYPIMAAERGGGGGAPIEPGSQTISKSVTVVFELE
ncbi:SIMPL domain-containing protein [Candidatus Gottesmanbacteria bacterium]|nr:SIMPL domain-containing protein [Candidatus Gottesmanbacteria bacterium]